MEKKDQKAKKKIRKCVFNFKNHAKKQKCKKKGKMHVQFDNSCKKRPKMHFKFWNSYKKDLKIFLTAFFDGF